MIGHDPILDSLFGLKDGVLHCAGSALPSDSCIMVAAIKTRSAMHRREFGQLMVGATLGGVLSRGYAQTLPPQGGSRFSVMLWTLEKQAPFDRCLEIVAEAGYQGVELTGQFQKWSSDETRRVMAKMRALRMTFDMLSGVKAGFADPAGATEFMAQVTAQMKAAKELESPQINLKSGNRIDSVSRSVQHATSIENLKRAADLAAANQVQIVVEPIDPLENPNMYLTSVSEAFEIIRAVDSPQVRVLYDFYHEQRAYGNLIEKLEQNIDLVGLVHIADVPGRHEPGTGEIDYANIYRKLGQLKYNKFITMEFYPTQDPVATLRKARLDAQQAISTATVT
jgi:hydroxypyruvate isomerase